MERSGAFGGRASCWYVGNIGSGFGLPNTHTDREGNVTDRTAAGPLVHVDVRSMYPHLLATRVFPTKRIGTRYDVDPRELFQLCESVGVIARVTIKTDWPELPLRIGQRVAYPIGQFVTTLTGPELLALQGRGEVLKCHTLTTYKTGRPFAGVADYLLSLRCQARDAGDATGERFAKLLANSLGGKLAQRAGGWVRDPKKDQARRWGEMHVLDADSGVVERWRFIVGVGWRWDDDKTGKGPHTSAFNYLTAYGRLLMADIRARLPVRSVVSQDTDGLWLTLRDPATATALSPMMGTEPGQLVVKGRGVNGRWYGPRHYCVDGNWVLSGFHRPEVKEDGRTVWEEHTTTLWESAARSAPSCTWHTWRKRVLKLDLSGERVQPDGWTLPMNRIPRLLRGG